MKLKIAVCDDDTETLNSEASIVKELCCEKNIQASVEQFTSPSALLERAELYSVVILDIKMDEMDGISLARQIAEKNAECYKIFITNYPIYLDKAFDVNAVRFLTKPVDKKRLGGGIDNVLERIKAKHKILHITQQKNKLVMDIEISTILYIETSGRHTRIISFEYGEIEAEEVFSEVKNMIEKEVDYFCQPHQSFFVNLNYVAKYTKEHVILAYAGNTYETAMSRRQYKDFEKNFFRKARKI
ncbi:MAG: LytTR family DNA-binding domain-containing protein [bacterium]|nr:LytTR family DNA-binding domain-containing protein [bacterium]